MFDTKKRISLSTYRDDSHVMYEFFMPEGDVKFLSNYSKDCWVGCEKRLCVASNSCRGHVKYIENDCFMFHLDKRERLYCYYEDIFKKTINPPLINIRPCTKSLRDC